LLQGKLWAEILPFVYAMPQPTVTSHQLKLLPNFRHRQVHTTHKTHTHTHRHNTHKYVHTRARAPIYSRTHIHTDTHTRTEFTRVSIRTNIHKRIHTRFHTHTHTHTCESIAFHTHTHTHTHPFVHGLSFAAGAPHLAFGRRRHPPRASEGLRSRISRLKAIEYMSPLRHCSLLHPSPTHPPDCRPQHLSETTVQLNV
jgi:hypothetical protein